MYFVRRVSFFFMFVNLKKLNCGSMVVRCVICLLKVVMEIMYLYEKVFILGEKCVNMIVRVWYSNDC